MAACIYTLLEPCQSSLSVLHQPFPSISGGSGCAVILVHPLVLGGSVLSCLGAWHGLGLLQRWLPLRLVLSSIFGGLPCCHPLAIWLSVKVCLVGRPLLAVEAVAGRLATLGVAVPVSLVSSWVPWPVDSVVWGLPLSVSLTLGLHLSCGRTGHLHFSSGHHWCT